MIKLTWAEINHPNFVGALKKLNNMDTLAPAVAYKIGKLTKIFQKEMTKAEKIEREITEPYLVPKKDKPEEKDYESPEKKAEAYEKFQAIMEEHEVKIDTRPLPFKQLKGLAPMQYIAIEKMLKDLPEFECEEGDEKATMGH
jgi:hypothetical protein